MPVARDQFAVDGALQQILYPAAIRIGRKPDISAAYQLQLFLQPTCYSRTKLQQADDMLLEDAAALASRSSCSNCARRNVW